MNRVITGIEQLISHTKFQQLIKGNIALLYHNASITADYQPTLGILHQLFPHRLVKLFGPQHGVVSDVQDNMVESQHSTHPHYKLPIYSLYSETRSPSRQMLKDIDTFIIDLQDVGTRVYTYISTLQYILETIAQEKLDITVVILDRPNPIGGDIIEGSILTPQFRSFVGRIPIPQRHGMTIAEIAKFIVQHLQLDIRLEIIPLANWKREFFFNQTGLPWVNPSPNLPTPESSYCFPGTVIFEGTNISEGRGTTRSLEIIGHPDIHDPFALQQEFLSFLTQVTNDIRLAGFYLRPIFFVPTFQKYQDQQCGGWHIHITDPLLFRPWKLTQLMTYFFYHHPTINFEWNKNPYEYEFEQLAIDLINGTDQLRKWIEQQEPLTKLEILEYAGYEAFQEQRTSALIY